MLDAHQEIGELRSPSIQRYIMELMSDMGEHFESVSTALSMFNEVGENQVSISART
jgi:hypothetical protein